MDLATIVGLLIAWALVIGSILLGPNAMIFLNLPSALIVVGGCIAVLIVRFDFAEIKTLISVILKSIKKPVIAKPRDIITKVVELSNISRREGILALEKQQIEDPFLQKGVNYCVDGAEADKIEEILAMEIEYIEDRHSMFSGMLASVADAGPAFGMIGTLVGLVQMLTAMDDPKSIGPAMAVALLTTLYGSLIANAFALPLKDKLDFRTKEELLVKQIIKSGVMGIHHGENPRMLEETLESFIAPNKRTSGKDGEG